MPGPCPGTWCIGDCVELDDVSVVESDATQTAFKVRVLQHCNSTIGNPDECSPAPLLSGFDLIVHFRIRDVPESGRTVQQCIRAIGFAPNPFEFEFVVDTPTNETGAPQEFIAESIIEGGKTGRTSDPRTLRFTVQPDGTVDPPTNGDGDDGTDGDGFDLGDLEGLARLAFLGVLLLMVVVAVDSLGDLLGDGDSS